MIVKIIATILVTLIFWGIEDEMRYPSHYELTPHPIAWVWLIAAYALTLFAIWR